MSVSFIGGGNRSTRRNPPTCRKSLTNVTTYCCIEYTSSWTEFELTTLVVIGTDCTGNCKSNYHTWFVFSDNIFCSNINTDINISWTTSLGQIYDVLSPSKTTIYNVLGDLVPNVGRNKYTINSKGTEQIDISVLNVSQNDGGIYQSVDALLRPNGCCLLIITGLYILFYFFITTKYIWRNGFFNLNNY
jgi:hypothetical protein